MVRMDISLSITKKRERVVQPASKTSHKSFQLDLFPVPVCPYKSTKPHFNIPECLPRKQTGGNVNVDLFSVFISSLGPRPCI